MYALQRTEFCGSEHIVPHLYVRALACERIVCLFIQRHRVPTGLVPLERFRLPLFRAIGVCLCDGSQLILCHCVYLSK